MPATESASNAREETLADHLRPLSDEPWARDWAVWRRLTLRAAGFPAERVLRLADPACAAAADRLLAAEEGESEAREAAAGVVRAALDELKASGRWGERATRKGLLDLLADLNRGGAPAAAEATALLGAAPPQLAALERARADLEEARAAYGAAYEAALAAQREEIHRAARDPRLQEAVLWQNRGAFHSAVRKVAESPPREARYNSQRRQHEMLVAMYLQRYAIKNDTIGFFGPVGWADFDDRLGGAVAELRPGTELLAERAVYLESWAVRALGETLVEMEGVRPCLAPRLLRGMRLRDGHLVPPDAPPAPLPPPVYAVLEACDGGRTARQIAAAAAEEGLPEEEVYTMLERLRSRGVIDWDFYLPPRPGALEVLAEQIAALDDEDARRRCTEALEELEKARRAVARAAGDPRRLDAALGELDATFQRLTGAHPTRKAGQTYAGRTLAYEDCRRDFEGRFSSRLLDAVAGPLSLLLLSARWVSHEVARVLREEARRAVREMAGESEGPVPALLFWDRFMPTLWSGEHTAAAMAELEARWRRVLPIDPAKRRMRFASAELRPAVEEAFPAPHPGWQQALYNSPDVLLAAAGPEALERGEYKIVLGEVHTGHNTLNNWIFLHQSPEPEKLLAGMALDQPAPRISLAPEKIEDAQTRSRPIFPTDDLHIVSPLDHIMPIPEGRELKPLELVVVETEDSAEVRTTDGRHRFDIAEVVGPVLSLTLAHTLGFFDRGEHCPRVLLDDLVLCREAWNFDAAALPFAEIKDDAERFLAARRWARGHGLPRHVFVSVATEIKPFYVDFASPVYIDHLAKMTRSLREGDEGEDGAGGDDGRSILRVTEMLPGPDELWLPDAEGNLYTSELRFVTVDRAARHLPWR